MNAITYRLALLGMCGALAAPPASAGLVTTIDLAAPVLTVMDLAPEDGIAARVDIVSMQTTLTAYLSTSEGEQTVGSTPLPYTAGAAALGSGPSTVSVSTDGSPNDLLIHTTIVPEEDSWVEAELRAEQLITLTLTPRSRITFAGHLSMRATWEGGDPIRGDSDGSVYQELLSPGKRARVEFLRILDFHTTKSPIETELDYQLSYWNDTDEAITMQWRLLSDLETELVPRHSPPPLPIPEAPAWAMLLGGLLLSGAAAARRRGAPLRIA